MAAAVVERPAAPPSARGSSPPRPPPGPPPRTGTCARRTLHDVEPRRGAARLPRPQQRWHGSVECSQGAASLSLGSDGQRRRSVWGAASCRARLAPAAALRRLQRICV